MEQPWAVLQAGGRVGQQEVCEARILILLHDLGKFLKALSLGGSSAQWKAHLCNQALSRGSPAEHLPPAGRRSKHVTALFL